MATEARREYTREYNRTHREGSHKRQKKYRDSHRGQVRQQQAEWKKNNADKVREGQRRYYTKHPEKKSRNFPTREERLWEKFGMTDETYQKMLDSQNGVCAICGRAETDGRHLAVDHDHATGALRGLLCRRCNISLGWYKDSIDLLSSAVSYLKKWNIR